MPAEPVHVPAEAGCCSTCEHAEAVVNRRGSVFVLCRLSKTDPRFPKYPRLPVTGCDGYRKSETPNPGKSA